MNFLEQYPNPQELHPDQVQQRQKGFFRNHICALLFGLFLILDKFLLKELFGLKLVKVEVDLAFFAELAKVLQSDLKGLLRLKMLLWFRLR